MGRHASAHSKLRIATWPIVTVVVVLALLGAGWLWWGQKQRADDGDSPLAGVCVKGKATLKVFGPDTQAVTGMIAAYNDTHPKVRDRCITAVLTQRRAGAGVAIMPGSSATIRAVLAKEKLSPATEDFPVVLTRTVGIAARDADPQPAPWTSWAPRGVAIPESKVSFDRCVAALALAGGDAGTASTWLAYNAGVSLTGLLAEQAPLMAVAQVDSPQGYTFIAPGDTTVPYRLVSFVNGTDELQARAGAEFAAFINDHHTPLSVDPTAADQRLIAAAYQLCSA